MLFGRVLDPQGAAVPGAKVAVKNSETGVTLHFETNATGYYEANLLMPGTYEVTAEAQGFKRSSRTGIVLPVSSRVEVGIPLELGAVAETVVITAQAPLLETNAVSSGRVLDNKTVMELPVFSNSAMLLVKLTPGIQSGGVNNYVAMHSIIAASDYQVNANLGGNTWTVDGTPNMGGDRHVAYLPYADSIAEFKVETSNFDASVGQTAGLAVQMISKSGTNQVHGTLTEQHWQQRWQATSFFVKQNYYRRIAAAEAAGNSALANQLRDTPKQNSGRSNNWGVSAAGPVFIPKVFDGRNKMFWFFTYSGFKDSKSPDPNSINRTVPTLNARNGDFSDMLTLPSPARYIIHDPLTVIPDAARPTHYVRTPFPGNIIPRSRFVNPAYDTIMKLYPLPNNPIPAGNQPVNNYLATAMPFKWDYKALSNRVDYQVNEAWRMFGRWSFNDVLEDASDWTYETARGLNSSGLVRENRGATYDVVWTKSPRTIFDFTVSANQFMEGNVQPTPRSYKPSSLGLPSYLDEKAGDYPILPLMNVAGYTRISPTGLENFVDFRMLTAKAEMTHIRGGHTLRAAFDTRQMFRTADQLIRNTSGNFNFSRAFMKRNDDDFTPSVDLGLGWAAFILGIPDSMTVDTWESYATHTPYHAGFLQDSWRVTPKLTLNMGLRVEWENGGTERYNRMISGFDPTLELPIAAAAQAAYAAAPLAELPASQFQVRGGSYYAGVGGRSRSLFKSQLMWLPRIGAAWQITPKTVVRAGYGIYYDTLNVLNYNIDQSGFARTTSTVLTNDFGAHWNFQGRANPANGGTPLFDPFPLRANGTRFDQPVRTALGAMGKVGRGFSFSDYNTPHPRQQRWRVSVQRQLGAETVVEAAYAGSYSDDVLISRKLDILPEKYWADGLVRNDANATFLNANVPNPFRLANFASLAQSQPLLYQDMSTLSFYTSGTIRRQQLLRAFPQMNGLTRTNSPEGYYTSHDFEASLNRRFANGFNLNVGYTALRVRRADVFLNEWDPEPADVISNNGRPHRVVGSAVMEMPFGKGKPLLGGVGRGLNYIVGGWQVSLTYEYQPGPVLDWGNVFYYGNDRGNILNVDRTWDRWFNTADFERNPARGPAAYHRRVFPTRVEELRGDMTNNWNGNLAKKFDFSERVKFQLRLDVINLQNRSQMSNPSTDPYSTNFGRITSQTNAVNRFIQIMGRLSF